ncbi:MAG: ATP-binding protein [Pseudomonadota bacterium]
MSFIEKIKSLWGDKEDDQPAKTKKLSRPDIAEVTLRALNYDQDFYILCASDGGILFFNTASARLFEHIDVGQSIFTILRTPLVREVFEELSEVKEKNSLEIELKLRIPVEKNLVLIALRAGEYYLLKLKDITDQKKALKMHGDFVANVSHELRTPLASICGFIETLQGPAKGDPDATEQFLAIMDAQSKRMNHLIQSLLSLSRIELDQHIAPTTECDLTKILNNVVEAMKPLMHHRGMRFEVKYDQSARPIIAADQQIFQVFQNLIENGMKYSPDDTVITIDIENTSGAWEVHVMDQGHGIEKDHIPRLTERFYRVDDARNRAEGGAGLGLSIVSKIIKRHRGMLNITSEVGKGSDFIVTLPSHINGH